MKKLLLIEDTDIIREGLAEALVYEGFKVFEAKNGQIGVQLAQVHRPDLIISDIVMPELNGDEVFWLLQANPATSHIPFIFVTAYSKHSLRELGIRIDVVSCLTKPFDFAELLNAINARLPRYASTA